MELRRGALLDSAPGRRNQYVSDGPWRLQRRAVAQTGNPSDSHVPEADVAVERRAHDTQVLEPEHHVYRHRQRPTRSCSERAARYASTARVEPANAP